MTVNDEVEAIKRMTPEQLAKAVAELSPADRARLDQRMKGVVSQALNAAGFCGVCHQCIQLDVVTGTRCACTP